MYYKCCVPSCNNKREDVKLHKFPNCKRRLQRWFTSINYVGFRGLRVSDFVRLQVCHKHFEKRFVTDKSRLLSNSYPTLFSSEEIATGVPITTLAEYDKKPDHNYYKTKKHQDHNYYKTKNDDESSLIEHNPPENGDEIGNDAGVADDVVVFVDEENQASGIEGVELITEETYQEIPDHNQVMLPSSTIEQTTKNQKPELSKDTCTSAPDPINQLDLRSQTKLVGQHTLHPSGNKSYPPAPILKKRNMCTDKEMLTKYRSLNKRYWNLRRSHELMKKRCKKPNMFETLTADMNPVAKEFFRTQLIVKRDSRGARFSPEVKILALSVMKLSSECYKLLRKIFILPSKNTLNSLYHSVTGKDIMDGDNLGPNDRDVLNQLDNILLKTGDEVNHDDGLDLPEDNGMEGNELNMSDTGLYTKQNYHDVTANDLNPTDANLRMTEDKFNESDTIGLIDEHNLNESAIHNMRQYKLEQYETNETNRQSSDAALVSLLDAVVDKPQTFKASHKSKVDGFNDRQAAGMRKILFRKSERAVDTTTREPVVNTRKRKEIQIGAIKSRKRHSARDKKIRVLENISLGSRVGDFSHPMSSNLHLCDSASVSTSWQNPDSLYTSFSADSEVSGETGKPK